MTGGTADLSTAGTVAEGLLALLKARGVDYLFANAGTDFPDILEAYARAPQTALALPAPVAVPHEHAALSMAHGHYLMSGQPQAAMVHVSVGLANSLCGLMNAARENVPIFMMAGRTPLTEEGSAASRDVSIHWGQEMYDQAGMLREVVKWDYELRTAGQLATLVDRALSLALSDPMGPVYLGLPRKVLGAAIDAAALKRARPMAPARLDGIDGAAIDEVAALIAGAECPLIITGRAGRDAEAVPALADFAIRAAVPVVEYRPNYMNLPDDHPMHAGFDFTDAFAAADLVIVLDTPAPWLPARHHWPRDARVVQIGVDPLAAGIPVRGFPADLTIAARPAAVLRQLTEALAGHGEGGRTASRRAVTAGAAARPPLPQEAPPTMTRAWASACLSQAKAADTVIVNELGALRPLLRFSAPGTFFGPSNADGLGWALPASLGMKLAAPDRLVVACVGDGSYMFANPVACHQVAMAQGLATLTLVFNNRRWEAVRTAALSVYPDGATARANEPALVALEPSPAFEEVARACGLHGEAVADPTALPGVLARAIERVRSGEPVLLNILID
ncbi:MAG: thiamine pyrophosphate-requiring protein [Rhodothalassiaceae bacterium]